MTYDCFCFFNETPLLELRLNILDPYVDKFVLCESTETFSGKEKKLVYQENKALFERWNHKIIHHNPGLHPTTNAFERAYFQKESLYG